jgi:alkanesulfonate monooxygenase SsuD/methylene tetrahydromethanopterin reductase-like flavin-dependent oxidoreductase (luciferase family)
MRTDLLLVPFGTSYGELRAAAIAAEDAGFNGIWTWDHLRDTDGDGPVPEALTTLAGIAEATTRLQLGPLVLNVNNRHPGLLANMAATLQQIAGGRLLLGLGAGGSLQTPYIAEQQMLGNAVPSDRERGDRVAEAAQILRLLWRGGTAAFAGQYYQLERARGFMPAAPPPPIVIGGFGPRMAAIAGRHGDGFNTPATHPDLARLIGIARRARERSGRDAATFEISVFSGLSERWLRPQSADRTRLEQLGVARLILLIEPPYPQRQIADAGALLGD